MSMTTCCMLDDIAEFLPRAAATSIIALYEIVGYLTGKIPDPISWDKFESTHGHICRVVGAGLECRHLRFEFFSSRRQTASSDFDVGFLARQKELHTPRSSRTSWNSCRRFPFIPTRPSVGFQLPERSETSNPNSVVLSSQRRMVQSY